jgi:hypothetical protein
MVLCAAGKYNGLIGQSNSSACLTCTQGSFCVAGTGVMDATMACPMGYYCPNGTGVSTAFPCPAGTFNSNTGAINSSSCTVCVSGRYCPLGSPNANNICPGGYFCKAGSMNFCFPGASGCDSSPPAACPNGTYTGTAVGLVDSSGCLQCPQGYFCGAGSAQPTPCPAGTYGAQPGISTIAGCSPCTPGFACPVSGSAAPTANCSTGYFCPAGTVFPTDNACPPGTYTDSNSLTRATDCSICPAGFACGFGASYFLNPPVICSSGAYCVAGTAVVSQYPCLPGTYSNLTGLTSSLSCYGCPPGMFCRGGETSPSGNCAAGMHNRIQF